MRTGASVYLRADGRWEARYQKARNEAGKIVYGYVYGATQEEAEKKRSALLLQACKDAAKSDSPLPSLNPNVFSIHGVNKQKPVRASEKYTEPLTDETAAVLDQCLRETKEAARVGFALCLHMGLSVAEAAALKYGQIDWERGVIHVESAVRFQKGVKLAAPMVKRDVVIPPGVRGYLEAQGVREKEPSHYVLSDDAVGMESNQSIGSAFRRIVKPRLDAGQLRASALRCTFIRTCLEANLNIESVSLITGMDKALLYRYYGKFITADPNAILRTERPAPAAEPAAPRQKRLNLLILGAGSHGQTVYETAQRLGIFRDIRFLDDAKTGENIIGSCADSGRFVKEFSCAFVAIGNNQRRKHFAEQLRKEGYLLPRIIHPSATVSQNAVIGDGTIIMAQATVDAAQVGEMCIIASNALVSRGAAVGDYCHLNSGAIVVKDVQMLELTLLRPGEIYQ